MYLKVWLKFLPVIRIMLKRSATTEQVVKMNRTDFDKAGGGKKVGYSFELEFKKGKVVNRYTSPLAKDLVTVLQNDELVMARMLNYGYMLEMTPKCELTIKQTYAPEMVTVTEE